jgi:hypothetical protein
MLDEENTSLALPKLSRTAAAPGCRVSLEIDAAR